jgi:hypothetical protein
VLRRYYAKSADAGGWKALIKQFCAGKNHEFVKLTVTFWVTKRSKCKKKITGVEKKNEKNTIRNCFDSNMVS